MGVPVEGDADAVPGQQGLEAGRGMGIGRAVLEYRDPRAGTVDRAQREVEDGDLHATGMLLEVLLEPLVLR